ncbi:cytochrome P450 CYP749A22-like isoform X2 [Gossypium arboreum]|uniref:cytochrome P450 CYP749A22-like isoform X2 n=1 Tax=Gossypium arboreum TaxID=29729 RepID=UPI0022F1D194|nr:cytochrome P450 CYP749A22-like isoform X2 [Gossypium arboreum]
MGNLLILSTAFLCLCLFVALLYVLYKYWWVPHRVQFIMNSQGIRGPPYEFIHGNNKEALQMQKEASSKPMALTHDIFPRVMPYDYSCIKKYGKNYLSWNGVRAQLNMIPAMIASVGTMLEKWKDKEGKEMEVFQEFRFLTSEVISRTAFGSSYLEGEKILTC